jgi:hypothetical protein
MALAFLTIQRTCCIIRYHFRQFRGYTAIAYTLLLTSFEAIE